MSLNNWFGKGMSFADYLESMEVNQAEVQHVYDHLEFTPEDHALFQEVAKAGYKGIVLTADWCGDAALNVPVMQRISELCQIELRYLIRDDNLELMDQYLTNGTSRAIPIFIFIDATGKEVSVWGPRSPEVQQMITELRATLPPADAVDFQEKQKEMYRTFKERISSDPEIWRTVIDSLKTKLTK